MKKENNITNACFVNHHNICTSSFCKCNCHFKPQNKKLKQLDEDMSAKLIKLSMRYPVVCYEYLDKIDVITWWARNQLRKINEE